MINNAGLADSAITAERIMIYGVTGSGKTTLARRLSKVTSLPWQPVDDLTWEADWVPVPDDLQRSRIAAICEQDSWVLDHAYGKWLDLPMARIQLIIGLDYPRWRSLSQLLRRTLLNIALRRPTCNGNVETLRLTFASDSIVRWHFKSFARKRDRMRAWSQDPSMPPVLLFRFPREMESWLSSLEAVGKNDPLAGDVGPV